MSEADAGDLRTYLSALEPDELVRRLLALAERDEIALMSLRAEVAVAAGTFDLAAFRKELTARLRFSGFVDRRGASEYAGRVRAVVDLLDELCAAGRADEVVVAAEHVMARLDKALNRIDDSDGYLGEVVSRLQDVHYVACVAARPDPRRLGVRLVEFELKTDWEWFLDAPQRYRDVLGDDGVLAYRNRLEREWETLPELDPDPRRYLHSFDGHRTTVTLLRESLARADGSLDELVAVLARDRSAPFRFCLIADELEKECREREALVWLERGIAAFPPAGDSRLRSRAVRAYLRDGQVEDAVALAQRAFDAEPSASTYGELREATSGSMDAGAVLDAALDRLREPTGIGGRTQAVRAQLEAGDVDGAWRDAQAGGCSWDLWRLLADARCGKHPDDALAVYRQLLERALERSTVGAYEQAIDLLSHIRQALAAGGRSEEFETELERIRAEQRRRPKLLTMLAAQRW